MTDLTIAGRLLTATIAPIGAELVRLKHEGRDVLCSGDPAVWSGRSPLLFPLVGRAPRDWLAIDGVLRPMPLHGFARGERFRTVSLEAHRCTLRLEASERTLALYPFSFELSVSYAVEGAELLISARVDNPGRRAMPFNIGFHPGFRCPIDPSGASTLLFPGDHRLRPRRGRDGHLGPAIPEIALDEGRLSLRTELFAGGALMLSGIKSRTVRLHAAGAPPVEVRFATDTLGLWSVPGAPFVCIEPWAALPLEPDVECEFADAPGIRLLPPGDSANFEVSIGVPSRSPKGAIENR